MRFYPRIFILLIALCCFSCNDVTFHVIRHASTHKEKTGKFRVGAAQKEITAMPGYPLAGFGGTANVGIGVWSHLFVHAICIEDEEGEFFIIVSCDLWSMPAGLADKACQLAASDSRYEKIGRDRVIISATHTHASQGNYTSTRAYNILASPGVGFDNALFQAMAKRIAETIRQAFDNKEEADLFCQTIKVNGLTRNRSYSAFLSNVPEAKEILKMNDLISPDPSLSPEYDSNCTKGINTDMKILTAIPKSKSNTSPIAVCAFFSMHQTVLGMASWFYNADVFGAACLHIKNYLASKNKTDSTVLTFFNAEEGDVSANWRKQNNKNVENISLGLSDYVINVLEHPKDFDSKKINGRISIKFTQIPLPFQPVDDKQSDLCGFQDGKFGTSSGPDIGFSAIGGAEDGYSNLHNVLGVFKEPMSGSCTNNGQGQKMGFRHIFFNKIKDSYSPNNRLLESNVPQDKLSDSESPKKRFPDNDSAMRFMRATLKEYKAKYKDTSIHSESLEVTQLSPPANILEELDALYNPQFPISTPIGIYTIGDLTMVALPGEFTTVSGLNIRKAIHNASGNSNDILLLGLSNEYLAYFASPSEYQKQHYEGGFTLYGEGSVPYLCSKFAFLEKNGGRIEEDHSITYSCGKGKEFGLENLSQSVIINLKTLEAFSDKDGKVIELTKIPKFDLNIIGEDLFWDRIITENKSLPIIKLLHDHKGAIDTLSEEITYPLSKLKIERQVTNYSSTAFALMAYPYDEFQYKWRVLWLNADMFPAEDKYQFIVIYPDHITKSDFFKRDAIGADGVIQKQKHR